MTLNVRQMELSHLYPSAFYSELCRGSASSAVAIVPMVMSLVNPTSVIDVGCGTGAWLSEFKRLGVRTVRGMDGRHVPPDQLLITPHEFQPIDLADLPPTGGCFDLALCLEVAEHLPGNAAGSLVRWLTRLAPVVLFSAAVPGQGGTGHLNEQWPAYWIDLFKRNGFVGVDCIRHRIWHDPNVEWWYRQNLLFFVSNETTESNEIWQTLALQFEPNDLTLVHSQILRVNESRRNWTRFIPSRARTLARDMRALGRRTS